MSPAHSSKQAGSDRSYTLDCEEPDNDTPAADELGQIKATSLGQLSVTEPKHHTPKGMHHTPKGMDAGYLR